MKYLVDRWNQFFFAPISPATIGVYRIVFGIVVFLSVLGKSPCRDIFYGRNAIVGESTTDMFFPDHLWWLFFRWLPQEDPGLKLFFCALLIASVALIFGLFSRLSSILVFVGLITLSNRNFYVDNHGDNFMRINSFFLMFAESGAAYSLDRWLKRKRQTSMEVLTRVSPWAQRLLQLQLSYLYIEAAVTKMPGQTWQDGTALYYAFNYLELRRFDFRFMFEHLWQVQLLTYGTLVAELSAGTLVWCRRLRYPLLIAAFLLHFGINLMMQFPVFQYVMISSLILFIYPEDMERGLARIKHLLIKIRAKFLST